MIYIANFITLITNSNTMLALVGWFGCVSQW